MKTLAKSVFFTALFISLFFLISWADEGKPTSLKGIEFLGGFGHSNLEEQGDYDFIPLFVDFDFDLKPFIKRLGINYPGLVEFIEEPGLSLVLQPNSNVEIANNFLIKIGILPETSKFQPYFKGGVGLIYMTQHTREQGNQFNFNQYIGAGFHYFFKKNMAFTAEYRYRHLSDADIQKPNSGINAHMGLVGVSYRF